MTKRVSLIDKAPNKTRYSDYFPFEFDHFHMSQVPITKLLKKDVTLQFDAEPYDLVILVGAEAAKEYAKVTSVTNMAGQLVSDKFVCITNPAMLAFKPEGKPDFQRALDKILKIYDGTSKPMASGDFAGINDTKEAKRFLREVLENAQGRVAWDTETTALYPRDGYVLGLSMTYKSKQGRYILTDCLDDVCLDLLQKIANEFETIFHNMKFDFKMIKYYLGIDFPRDRVHDTMCMHYVLDENDSHGLKQLALKFTDLGDYERELDEYKKNWCRQHKVKLDDFNYGMLPPEIIAPYGCKDGDATMQLFQKFSPKIWGSKEFTRLYETILKPVTRAIIHIENNGGPIDLQVLEELIEDYRIDIEETMNELAYHPAVQQFEETEQKTFNPNSVFHLREILFNILKLKPIKKTETGASSTDAEVLESLKHPITEAILDLRKKVKLSQTYLKKIS